MRNQRRLRTAAAFAALALAGLGACGRSDNNSSGNNNSSGGDQPSGTVDASSKTGPGFDGKTITVGLLTVSSGPVAAIGDPMSAGNEVYWKRINEKGGVAGKYKVELKKYDTKYTDSEAVTQYGLSKDSVAMYGQILGTNVVNGVKDLLTADGILGQPATLDAYWTHEPELMPFGAPYQIQAINGLDYAVRKLDGKNKTVCALTKDDDYGKAGLAGYEYAVTKLGLKGGAKATFKTGDDMTATINTLQQGNCGIVLYTGLSIDTSATIQAAAARQFNPKWIALSASWNSTLSMGTDGKPTALAPYLEQNFFLAAEGYNWGDTSNPAMKQMLDDVAKYKPDQTPNGYFTFGWNEAWAVHQVLEKAAELGDLTQSGILEASHKIDKLEFGDGYGEYTYGDPADRAPTRQTTVFGIKAAAPNGTDAQEVNFVSEAAKAYDLP
jgi:ABC-type branched-subunit amino acid transport system substrate-binding protein